MRDAPPFRLEISRVFDAPREKVFGAFVDPASIRAWWAPKGWRTPHAEMDVRVGGKYRFGMRSDDDPALMFVHGEYLVVEPPERLVFTYIWEEGGAGNRWKQLGLVGVTTTVALEFRPLDGKTEVILCHEGFPTDDGRDQHRFGWSSNWDCLEEYLLRGSVKTHPHQ